MTASDLIVAIAVALALALILVYPLTNIGGPLI